MNYQALKHLKTKTKVLKMCKTLKEAHEMIRELGGEFQSFSYIGGFPVYQDKNKKLYSIQGSVQLNNGENVVCSIGDEEKNKFNFYK